MQCRASGEKMALERADFPGQAGFDICFMFRGGRSCAES